MPLIDLAVGGFDFRSMGQNPEWSIVTELKKQYDVESVAPDVPVPSGIDVLIVAQPSSLAQKQIDNLRTNHQGVYVLLDNRFRFLTQMSASKQFVDLMPKGDYRIQDKKVTPPPRGRIDESMEALIHHFKIFTEGFKVPEGEVYVAVESPRGELGCYLVSNGSARPYRMRMRGPSFVNLQTLPHMMRGGFLADGVAVISSVDPIMGEVDR